MVIENEYREKPAEQIEKFAPGFSALLFFSLLNSKLSPPLSYKERRSKLKQIHCRSLALLAICDCPLGTFPFLIACQFGIKLVAWEQALLHVFVRASGVGVVVEVVITLTMKMKMRMMLRWMMTKNRQRVIAWVIRHYLMYVVLKSDGQSNHHLIIIMMMRSKPRENARARGRGPNRRACSQAIKLVTRPTKSPIFS